MNTVGKCILCVLIVLVTGCSSSIFLDKLRRQKLITFVSDLSSANEIAVDEGAQLRLTCAFLSNFDRVNVFWFHNGTLLQSFLSKSITDEEDDAVEHSYLAATIVATIEIETAHFDTNGVYQCIAVHDEITSQHHFDVHVKTTETDYTPTKFSENALMTVHTYQTLFEPRSQTSLMCRVNAQQKNECTVRWFDPDDEPLETTGEQTDLVLVNANFDDHMGLYKCQICCHDQCRTLTSFVYPAGSEN